MIPGRAVTLLVLLLTSCTAPRLMALTNCRPGIARTRRASTTTTKPPRIGARKRLPRRLLPDAGGHAGPGQRPLHGLDRPYFQPAADPLFVSMAEVLAERAINIVLSGYLDDGARGTAAVRCAGSVTMAQDEATAECFAMP